MKLKSTTVICASLLLVMSQAFSQPDTSTTEKLLHYIMQPLDKSQVPTAAPVRVLTNRNDRTG